ncbi:MAG: DUF2071 domain-containing protein [Deltaproteobacteria bacterium]
MQLNASRLCRRNDRCALCVAAFARDAAPADKDIRSRSRYERRQPAFDGAPRVSVALETQKILAQVPTLRQDAQAAASLREEVYVRIPVIQGVIQRRILVNYRVDPAALCGILPAPFRPHLVEGTAIAGICLIRLTSVRPRLMPAVLGITSENAAHRIAVEWDDAAGTRHGVYIPRRDSSSWLNQLLGGRFFPGEHGAAEFDVRDDGDHFRVQMDSATSHVLIEGHLASSLPPGSVFKSLGVASRFFEQGTLGYSATSQPGRFEGLTLSTRAWKVEPVEVTRVESSFFEDVAQFPAGSTAFDCALLMRNIPHEWLAEDDICVNDASPAA